MVEVRETSFWPDMWFWFKLLNCFQRFYWRENFRKIQKTKYIFKQPTVTSRENLAWIEKTNIFASWIWSVKTDCNQLKNNISQ